MNASHEGDTKVSCVQQLGRVRGQAAGAIRYCHSSGAGLAGAHSGMGWCPVGAGEALRHGRQLTGSGPRDRVAAQAGRCAVTGLGCMVHADEVKACSQILQRQAAAISGQAWQLHAAAVAAPAAAAAAAAAFVDCSCATAEAALATPAVQAQRGLVEKPAFASGWRSGGGGDGQQQGGIEGVATL